MFSVFEEMPLDQMLARVKKYNPGDGYLLVEKAYHFAEKAHAPNLILPENLIREAAQEVLKNCAAQGVPFTNYGTVIAAINGILQRSIQIIYK